MTQAANLAALGTNAGTTGILPIAGGGTAGTGGAIGFKNRIINGAMVIDQRNAGASVTANDGVFPVDRFKFAMAQNSKATSQQSTTAPTGFINSLLVTSSSAYSVLTGDYFNIAQNIEGLNCTDLGWGTVNAKTVTLSFWVRSSLTGTFGGSLNNSANDRSYPFSYTISSANTWEQKTITVVGDTSGTWLTTNGIGIRVFFSLGAGSTYLGSSSAWGATDYRGGLTGATSVVGTNGATFYITGVQLEVGTAATNFDVRSYGTELALCQRYYEKIINTDGSNDIQIATGWIYYNSGEFDFSVPFLVQKRASPTITASATSGSLLSCYGTNLSAGSFPFSGSAAFRVLPRLFQYNQSLSSSAGGGAGVAVWVALKSNQYFEASAEL